MFDLLPDEHAYWIEWRIGHMHGFEMIYGWTATLVRLERLRRQGHAAHIVRALPR